MKCLRCGYCCHYYLVPIIDDPDGPGDESNIIIHTGEGKPCKHLAGNKPGEYTCMIHDESYYKDTPCFSHSQIESSPNDECRIGRYIIDNNITYD